MNPLPLALAAVLAFAMPARAECTWEWLCNGEGACKQMPVCGSIYEHPPPRPKEGKPPPPLPPLIMRHNTFSGRGVSPGTTLSCEHIMRPDRTGRWVWTEACFCADPEKTKDKSPPFANIVRCEDPGAATKR